MPDIPGLPALITMLFSPIMELRSVKLRLVIAHFKQQMKNHVNIFPHFCSTDEDRTCYTGALCGLAWNSQTGEGILPEHDIELAFDVRFDVEDIYEVTEAEPLGLIVVLKRTGVRVSCPLLLLLSDSLSRLVANVIALFSRLIIR